MRITIGISIPNVPQAVPIENDRNAATRKITTGRNCRGKLLRSTTPPMYSPVERRSPHTPEIVQAKTKIVMAGTIIFIPSLTLPMKSLKVSIFLGK